MKQIKRRGSAPMFVGERAAYRFPTQLLVDLGGISGYTRNLSAYGIYFETIAPHRVGASVHLLVSVNFQGKKLTLKCEGEVVRIDQQDAKLGIAVKFSDSFFADAPEVVEAAALQRYQSHRHGYSTLSGGADAREARPNAMKDHRMSE